MALIAYDESRATKPLFLRALLIGPPKSGKTCSVLTSAPKPFLINGDGHSATRGAINLGAKFTAVDVTSCSEWRQACQLAADYVKEERARTIVVDTITLLADTLHDDIVKGGAKNYDIWTKQADELMGGYRFLAELPAHLIYIAHMKVDSDMVAGILPLIGGMTKQRLPGIIDDWILFECDPSSGQRSYLLGPQKSWGASGRNIQRTCKIPANVPALLKELGLNP